MSILQHIKTPVVDEGSIIYDVNEERIAVVNDSRLGDMNYGRTKELIRVINALKSVEAVLVELSQDCRTVRRRRLASEALAALRPPDLSGAEGPKGGE